jgi:ferrous iron transport protein A
MNISLDQAERLQAYTVAAVTAPPSGVDWPQRLEDLGFLPGEPVMVVAHAVPGADPLAVRVGDSMYALRRAEAACVRVQPAGQAAR